MQMHKESQPMQGSLLAQLSRMSVIVADTGDLEAIAKWRPRDATTNPTLITQAVEQGKAADLLEEALTNSQRERAQTADQQAQLHIATEAVLVAFGTRILSLIPGRVSTEVDARLSHDTEGTIAQAERLIRRYEAQGISRERVLIKIASTFAGIRAAQQLEKRGIHCNLTLLFSLNQAVACAAAKVTLISPFVGRILDWYKQRTGRQAYSAAEDPGVLSVQRIYNHLKHEQSAVQIMGASFRNMGEILGLAGCDLLTISPAFLQELHHKEGVVIRRLDPKLAQETVVEKISDPLEEQAFLRRHAQDPMATEKLEEGIATFAKALETLESILLPRIHP